MKLLTFSVRDNDSARSMVKMIILKGFGLNVNGLWVVGVVVGCSVVVVVVCSVVVGAILSRADFSPDSDGGAETSSAHRNRGVEVNVCMCVEVKSEC